MPSSIIVKELKGTESKDPPKHGKIAHLLHSSFIFNRMDLVSFRRLSNASMSTKILED